MELKKSEVQELIEIIENEIEVDIEDLSLLEENGKDTAAQKRVIYFQRNLILKLELNQELNKEDIEYIKERL